MCPSPEQICVGGSCFNPGDLDPPDPPQQVVTVGGGGGCSTGGGDLGLGAFGLLGMVIAWRRRQS